MSEKITVIPETYDEKKYLELLMIYKSEGTRRARRNLSLLAFIVIVVHALGLKIAALKVFGMPLEQASEKGVVGVFLLLTVYWCLMYYLSLTHDEGIQKERTVVLNNIVHNLKLVFSKMKERHSTEFNHVKDSQNRKNMLFLEMYEQQVKRTEGAQRIGSMLHCLESVVPFVLAAIALVFLVFSLFV